MAVSAEVGPTPVEVPAATPATEPVSAPNGTAEINGSEAQVAEAAPSEDTFLSGDPNSLPQELQEHYKNMLSDYKKKTQAIAEDRKKFSPDVFEKAQRYEKISQDQKFVEYWNGLSKTERTDYKEAKQEAEQSLGQSISDEEFTKAWDSKDGVLSLIEKVIAAKSQKDQKRISELEQKLTVNEAADVVESFATEVGQDGKSVRPDFYDLDKDNLITGYLSVNPPEGKGAQAYQARLNEAYAWAKSVSQKYYEKGKAEALAIVTKKAAASTQPPTNSTKQQYSGIDPKKVDAHEAVALARRNIRIPQDY